ncbi:hypothetical protein GCM10009787_13810 [Streptomyces bangladeshensis]|uniref:Uncharacterized protein n=1 Tax=Streptomyces bangladeshensis TaxID=295352 RepID=A0ABN3BE36_9ACTN
MSTSSRADDGAGSGPAASTGLFTGAATSSKAVSTASSSGAAATRHDKQPGRYLATTLASTHIRSDT